MFNFQLVCEGVVQAIYNVVLDMCVQGENYWKHFFRLLWNFMWIYFPGHFSRTSILMGTFFRTPTVRLGSLRTAKFIRSPIFTGENHVFVLCGQKILSDISEFCILPTENVAPPIRMTLSKWIHFASNQSNIHWSIRSDVYVCFKNVYEN